MRKATSFVFSIICATGFAGCGGTAPETFEARHALNLDSQGSLTHFRDDAPGMDREIGDAYGYVIFPDVGKGALIAGGAYGKGTVYERGTLVGYADVSAGSIGVQAGGETFAELILFRDKPAFEKFINNQAALDAKASAVAIKPGAAVAAQYDDGVAVFTHPLAGLMVEAAVGGQKFTYISLESMQRYSSPESTDANTANPVDETGRPIPPTTLPGTP